jgi:hypothetical protein
MEEIQIRELTEDERFVAEMRYFIDTLKLLGKELTEAYYDYMKATNNHISVLDVKTARGING